MTGSNVTLLVPRRTVVFPAAFVTANVVPLPACAFQTANQLPSASSNVNARFGATLSDGVTSGGDAVSVICTLPSAVSRFVNGYVHCENWTFRCATWFELGASNVFATAGSAEKRDAQMLEEAKAAARAEADRIIAAAKADIDQQVARAKEMLREQVAALAVAGAEKILRREVDAKAHADLLEAIKRDL